MQNNLEQNSVLFHDRAKELLFASYSDFRHTVSLLDREGDENVFQQTLGRYMAQLKQSLTGLAREVLDDLKPGSNRDQQSQVLSSLVEQYLNEFRHKVRTS
jgi:hypothetical protein